MTAKSLMVRIRLLFAFLLVTGVTIAKEPTRTEAAADPLRLDFPAPGSVIQFFYVTPKSAQASDDKEIEIFAVTQRGSRLANEYVGTIEIEGGSPHIESVFLDNADRDEDKELFVLAR